jgi:hypothetical protein
MEDEELWRGCDQKTVWVTRQVEELGKGQRVCEEKRAGGQVFVVRDFR